MSVKSKLMKLIPVGLVAERCEVTDGALVVAARSVAVDAPCPDCGVVSGRVHSRYQRTLCDWSGPEGVARQLRRPGALN